MTDERRKAPRFGCPADAEIVLPGRGMHYPGRLVDLSAGGCFVETTCRLERGTLVEVWMNPEGQPLRVTANLLVKRSNGVGCRFIGVTQRKQEQIRHLISELETEQRRQENVFAGAPVEAPGGCSAEPTTSLPGRRSFLAWLLCRLRRRPSETAEADI